MSFDTTSKALAQAFGNALRTAREATDRTTEQAADLLYCDHDYYCRLESGQSLPSLYLAARAVDRLGVDPAAALGSQLTDEHRAAIAALRQECEDLQTELGRVRTERDKALAVAIALPAPADEISSALEWRRGKIDKPTWDTGLWRFGENDSRPLPVLVGDPFWHPYEWQESLCEEDEWWAPVNSDGSPRPWPEVSGD